MHLTHHTPTALAYADAALELATEQNLVDTLAEELSQARQLLADNPTFAQFLADPGIGVDERTRVIDETFGGKTTELFFRFVKLLNHKGRIGMLGQIAAAFDDLLAEQRGKIEVDVTVAHKLSPDEAEAIRHRIGEALHKDVVTHVYVDESIIGGMLLRVQDKLIDASVKGQLQAIKQKILAARPE